MDTYEGDLEFNREESTIGPFKPNIGFTFLFLKPIKCESIFLTANSKLVFLIIIFFLKNVKLIQTKNLFYREGI